MNTTDDFCNPGDIEYYVAKHIRENQDHFKDKTCIDSPAGQGVTSRVLFEVGAKVIAYDIFPEYFKFKQVKCEYADLTDKIPLPDNYADCIICQEGLEHINDHLSTFKEFNRVLKPGGRLLITVPNYSNIKSKLSYLFFESECYGRDMPTNELDTIWHAQNQKQAKEIYFGHAFPIGIQKLRFLGKICGFSLTNSYKTKRNKTSLLYFPFLFPLIYLVTARTYFYARRKKKQARINNFKDTYNQCRKLNINSNTLLRKNLFVEFKKEHSINEACALLADGKEHSPWETISNKQKQY